MAPSSAGSRAERCSICGKHRWAVENTYLAHGSAAARALCEQLGISQSAFYRHIKAHLPLTISTPPPTDDPLEWVRATMNLVAAIEAYRIIAEPAKVGNLAVLVSRDDESPFIELAITHFAGALDSQALEAMAFDLGLEVEQTELLSGMNPTVRTCARLRSPEIFVGKRSDRK